MQEGKPGSNEQQSGDSLFWRTTLFASGVFVGLVAGIFLFVATYPWLGPANSQVWGIVLEDGSIIGALGAIAYYFRRRSPFFPGLLTALCVVFIVNGLCGVNR
jgi:hypothetical protein